MSPEFLTLPETMTPTTDLQLFTELSSLPADLKREVEDFINSLKS
jgi:hypothetical protein